jgi:hypothetical protein
MRRARLLATLLAAATPSAAGVDAAQATTPACRLITRAEAQSALGARVSLSRGEDSTLCNIEYGNPRRDLIMALNPNRPGARGYAAQKRQYRSRVYTDASGTKVTFAQKPLRIAGTTGFEDEVFTEPLVGGASPDPARYLILLHHGKILSFETTVTSRPATFPQIERLARAAMRRF